MILAVHGPQRYWLLRFPLLPSSLLFFLSYFSFPYLPVHMAVRFVLQKGMVSSHSLWPEQMHCTFSASIDIARTLVRPPLLLQVKVVGSEPESTTSPWNGSKRKRMTFSICLLHVSKGLNLEHGVEMTTLYKM